MTDPLVDSKVAESAQAAAVAKEAEHNAISEMVHSALVEGLRKVLVDDEDNSPILVKSKIKRICDDVQSIKTDLWWIKWIGSGFVVAAGMLALKALGA